MSDSATPRRDFLAQLAAGTAAAAIGTIARPAAAAARIGGELPNDAPSAFDDSWTRRVKSAKHRIVFDAPDHNDGLALSQAWIYRAGYRDALGDAGDTVVPVVVLRHRTASLGVDDAMWAKYGLGEIRKIDDPDTKKPAERNPWSRTPAGKQADPEFAAALSLPYDPTVEGVIRSGGIVLVCNLALRAVAAQIATARKLDTATVHADLRANLVPGAIAQPSGVYATARAQEVGAVFMRST